MYINHGIQAKISKPITDLVEELPIRVWTLVGKLDLAGKKAMHPAAAAAKSLQSCPTLCNPIGGNPPGSPVPEILQARTLEWVAISFSNASK